MNEENRTFALFERLTNHPAGDDSLTCAARSDSDDAFKFFIELFPYGVDKLLLIRSELDTQDATSFLKRRILISPLCF